jgi:hypothetical protein
VQQRTQRGAKLRCDFAVGLAVQGLEEAAFHASRQQRPGIPLCQVPERQGSRPAAQPMSDEIKCMAATSASCTRCHNHATFPAEVLSATPMRCHLITSRQNESNKVW